MTSNYRVKYKLSMDDGSFETLAEFDCDKVRYLHEIDIAIRKNLSFSAVDSLLTNGDGNKVYGLTIYIW